MVTGQVFSTFMLDDPAASFLDTAQSEHPFDCHPSQQYDQLRIDQLNLRKKISRRAGLDLERLRRPIGRGAALDDVRDKERVSINAASFEHMVEITPGRPDKR